VSTIDLDKVAEKPDEQGFDEDELDLGVYPLDSLLIRQETRTVYEILRRINQDKYIMNPDFQRDFLWDDRKQSKLIESCLLRIPLPVFYLAEQEDGRTIVVDGLQRLSTFKRFLDDQLPLIGLDKNNALNGMRFSDLSPQQQNRIEDTQLILYLIDHKVPPAAKLDIFERVNSGIALTRQQMRNALYTGPATRWLAEQAESERFLEATGGSLNRKQMRDREAINRFCAFTLIGFEKYEGKMDEFLANTLELMNKRLSRADLDELARNFQIGMANNIELFGRFAFRKHNRDATQRNVINIGLFDVFSVLMARYRPAQITTHKKAIRDLFYDLMEEDDFLASISLGTNQKNKVRTRFAVMEEAIEGIMI